MRIGSHDDRSMKSWWLLPAVILSAALTVDDEYFCHDGKYLLLPIQKQLSKKPKFSSIFWCAWYFKVQFQTVITLINI